MESAVLLFRSRGDVREPSLISAGREDLLRRDPCRRVPSAGHWMLARRTISVDESVLRTQNLAIFLCPARGGGERRSPSPTSSPRSACGRSRPATGRGWMISSPRSGQWVALCPLELEALTWQSDEVFSAMVGNPYGSLDIGPDD